MSKPYTDGVEGCVALEDGFWDARTCTAGVYGILCETTPR